MELVNCITKYANNGLFPSQATLAQELLCVCAEKLGSGRLVTAFVNKSGKQFYNTDLENMAMYPPTLGLSYENQRQPERSTTPSEEQVRLSVTKGLWFPILNALSNLVLEKNTAN